MTVAVLVNEPLVPVTRTVKVPTVVALIVKVEDPVPLIVKVLSEAVISVGLETLNATVVPNPFRSLRLITEVLCAPVLIDRLGGLAERLKSRKLKIVVAERTIDPLVPVIVSG